MNFYATQLRVTMSQNQQASALIMVVSLLVLMISVAITFLELVGRQNNSTIGVAAQVKSEIAVQQAQAHLIKCFTDTATRPTRHTDGTEVKYSSYSNQQWMREFGPVTDPDGNPFTDTVDFADGSPLQGKVLPVGTESTGRPSTTMVSNSPMVNTKVRLYELMDLSMLQFNEQIRRMSTTFGFPETLDRADTYYFSRWHNIEYLDADFKTITIDPSLSPADKADIRRTSRYVLRYTGQAIDLHGMHTINSNFPHELHGDDISRSAGSTDTAHYLRYQNYLRCYGRSLKSQWGIVNRKGTQHRRSDSYDPLDRETVSLSLAYSNGGVLDMSETKEAMYQDARIRMERAFRDGDLHWSKRYGVGFAPLSPGHKGKVYTWSHLRSVHIGDSSGLMWDTANYMFTPFGDGMLDADLSETVASASEVSTPWRINLLSAPKGTLRAMIYGLSSHLNFKSGNAVAGSLDKEARIHAGLWAGHKIHVRPTDLFGIGYPEPFPLSYDSGRNVPIIGDEEKLLGTDGALYIGPGGMKNRSEYRRSGSEHPAPSCRLSYLADIGQALYTAIDCARTLWDDEKALRVDKEFDSTLAPWGLHMYRGDANNSLITPVDSSTTADEMLSQVIRETYRILGEGPVLDSVSGSNPATSMGSIDRTGVFDPNGKTLLAGGRTLVGAGSIGNISFPNKKPSPGSGDWEISAQLEPSANTRAMEYVLNDLMISLFGKANPAYVIGSKDYKNIAVDFNGDGKAESTVTGWWDQSGNQVWSWWWDGLGPYVQVNPGDEYMKEGAWYRFRGTDILRKVNGEWVPVPDSGSFLSYNNIWLTGSVEYPIKPFSKTGRLFIGRSKLMNGFIRAEVYDILNKKPLAVADRYFVYRMDPNNDEDFSDSHVIIQTDDLLAGQKE